MAVHSLCVYCLWRNSLDIYCKNCRDVRTAGRCNAPQRKMAASGNNVGCVLSSLRTHTQTPSVVRVLIHVHQTHNLQLILMTNEIVLIDFVQIIPFNERILKARVDCTSTKLLYSGFCCLYPSQAGRWQIYCRVLCSCARPTGMWCRCRP